jgi:hypothetical protein
MVNPTDGPLGENPGWQGFTLPGLQGSGYSPLLATPSRHWGWPSGDDRSSGGWR